MKCDFCGEDLPIVGGFSGLTGDDLEAFIDRAPNVVLDGWLYIDIDGGIVTQFFRPKIFPALDGYQHLCRRCASKIDTYADKLLEAYRDLELKLARSSARNAVNARRGKNPLSYMIAFDLDIPAHPVAQVFEKTDGLYRLCNELEGDAAGTVLKYMEGMRFMDLKEGETL